jgi:hypothetical protein
MKISQTGPCLMYLGVGCWALKERGYYSKTVLTSMCRRLHATSSTRTARRSSFDPSADSLITLFIPMLQYMTCISSPSQGLPGVRRSPLGSRVLAPDSEYVQDVFLSISLIDESCSRRA